MENQRPTVGVGVLVLKEGEILLGKRRNSHGEGQWAPPGGYLEYGESFESCALRELREETNLVGLSHEIGPWTSEIIDGKHCISFFVYVDKFEGELQITEPDKCLSWEWFSLDDLPTPLFPPVKSLFEQKKLAPPQKIL